MTTGMTQAPRIEAGTFDDLLIEALGARKVTGVLSPPAADHPAKSNGHGAAHGPGHGHNGANGNGNGNGHAHSAVNGNGNGLAVADAVAALAAVSPAARLVDSTPDHAAFARHFRRSLITAAPLVGADVVALGLAGVIAQLLIWLLVPGASASGAMVFLSAVPLLLGFWLVGLYSEVWVHPALELRQSTLVATVALLGTALVSMSRAEVALWCLGAWAVAVPGVPLMRGLARCCCAGRSWWGFPTLVIGAGPGGDALARTLMRVRSSGLRPVLLTDPDATNRASIVPVVNDPAVLESLVRSKGIRHAVLCLSDLPASKVAKAFDCYGAMASHLLVVCEPPPLPGLWGAQRMCGLGGVEVRNGLLLAGPRAAKRAMDLFIGVVALTAGLPLLATIALLVKLSSAGPVLYGHTRIGRNGRRFTAWKFRTMYRGADALLSKHFERFPLARVEWERDQKLRDDPRVTRVGRFLRTLSLDELPQMWNVLRGEMSVVGPRPIVDDEVARYGDCFHLYAAVKPGITGLWQVSGRTDVGYEMRVRLDEFYVRQWSCWLDAYLLVRTVAALLCRRGAY